MQKIGYFIVLLTCLNNSDLLSQKRNLVQIDNLMKQIPDSLTHSTDGIASYITSNIYNQKNKAYAIFSWITENIQYDVTNMFSIEFFQPNNVVETVLSSKAGVCLHYSTLFNEIANKVGIKSYVVLGYTKQNGLIDHIPHSWCAGLIDTAWYFFDPAWGSGYFENGLFYKQKNLRYFMISPSRNIKTHMPFDPMWQFLNFPVSNYDFNNHKTINPYEPYFNYVDSINKYVHQTELERLESSISRIKQNGITNVLIFREIKYLDDKIMTYKYNKALQFYNEGIAQLNQSIQIWNEFVPDKNANKIIELLDSAEYSVTLCEYNLKLIRNPSGFITISLNQMTTLVDIAEKSIKDLRSAVLRYLNSRK